MKIALFRSQENLLPVLELLSAEGTQINEEAVGFIGYIELSIEKPKKLVTRQIIPQFRRTSMGIFLEGSIVPPNAKNIKCTYEVEE